MRHDLASRRVPARSFLFAWLLLAALCVARCEVDTATPAGDGAAPPEDLSGPEVTEETACEPDCAGKACGPDGCEGSCGACTEADAICLAGACCLPDCAGRACGDDGCGGSCGACPEEEHCGFDGTCVDDPCVGVPNAGCCKGETLYYCQGGALGLDACGAEPARPSCGWNADFGVYECGTDGGADPSGAYAKSCDELCLPSCGDRVCGEDGCGGSCGACASADQCVDGQCVVCEPQCEGRECGSDSCGGSCGECAGALAGCVDGACVCTPACGGKACGDDGCGGICGECAPEETCNEGYCVCLPECEGKACGDDGCGGLCGYCQWGCACEDAACVAPVTGLDNGCDGTVTDAAKGRTWQQEFGGSMHWGEAKGYCNELVLGGHDDWRLPSVSELRGLVKGCSATTSGGACGVIDGCLAESCLGDACAGCAELEGPGPDGWYLDAAFETTLESQFWTNKGVGWSATDEYAFVVQFTDASVFFYDTMVSFKGVRCVR